MGFLWGLLRTAMLCFAVVIAALVVIDGSLLANLFKTKDE
jgi:hypothetical protein